MGKLLLLSTLLTFSLSSWAETCTTEIEISGTIGPASLDLLERGLASAGRNKCESLFLQINTPGGSLQTTRLMVERILNSPIPVLCLVAPAGAHAGSAGAIILQACHVNGATEGTNLGAATPVSGQGELPEDLRKKIINDTKSWMDSVTKLRGRSEEFGRDIVVDAKAVSAEDALKLKAIDTVVKSKDEFLKFAAGRSVRLSENQSTQVKVGEIMPFQFDLRYRTLDLLTDPQTAYLILMGSLALLYFEVTHPGTLVPGVLGGIGLVISLVALHKLNVEWGGLALIFLGLALLIAEMFVPSFGALGMGGIASFLIGSFMLFDPEKTGYRLPLSLILQTGLLLGGIMLGVGYLVVKAHLTRRRGGFDDMGGLIGTVVEMSSDDPRRGQMEVAGETWAFEADHPVALKDKLKVKNHKGLTLIVSKEV